MMVLFCVKNGIKCYYSRPILISLPNLDRQHKERNQYGNEIQAIALSLMVTGNVAINKVHMLISGMTNGEVNLSEGFICKLYKRGYEGLEQFKADLCRIISIWKGIFKK